MNESTEPRIQDVICQTANKGKFLEFRDALNLAYLQDYAMIQGVGGKDHAFNSGIRVWITDYTKKGSSFNVYANVRPEVLEQAKAICEYNTGTIHMNPDPVSPMNGLAVCSEIIKSLVRDTYQGLRLVAKGKMDLISMVGKMFGEAKKQAEAKEAEKAEAEAVEFYKDFTYEQTRVFPADGRQDGKYTVQILSFVRRQYRGEDKKEKSKMPWLVSVSNFYASPKHYDNGTTSYLPNTAVERKDGFVQLTDADMYAMCYRAGRFVEIWENVFGMPLVKQGWIARQQQMDSRQ